MKALSLDKKNVNTVWDDVISKEIIELEKLGVFQLYLPKSMF